jgi:hypothetical protein
MELMTRCIRECFSGISEEGVATLLGHLASGLVQGWAITRRDGGQPEISAVGLTGIEESRLTGARYLVLHGLLGVEGNVFSLGEWRGAYRDLERYAKENRCTHVRTVCMTARAERMAETLGFEFGGRMARREVTHEVVG